MSESTPPPAPASAAVPAAAGGGPAVPAGRDLTLDLARVACVLVVVFVHTVMIGVTKGSDGSPVITSPLDSVRIYDAVSWLADIMPLFFVVGGFAAASSWASTVARGGSAADFVRVRVRRLARPALPLFAFFVVAIGVALLLGVPEELLSQATVGVGAVLWFLGAYMAVQALAPFMIGLHRKAPWLTLAGLLAGAVLVDVVRLIVGIWTLGLGPVPSVGYGVGEQLFGVPNVLFVWLFAQQLGFAYHDGWFARRSTPQLLALTLGAFGAVALITWIGVYSWNMLANQWPPTTPMALLAIAQASLLALLKGPLTSLMRRRWAQGVVFLFGSRLMTIYLWHAPVILALVGLNLVLPLPMPTPGTSWWWFSRIPFVMLVLAVVWLISLATARLEAAVPVPRPSFPGTEALVVAVLCMSVPTVLVSLYGLDLTLAVTGLVGTAVALVLTSGRRDGSAAERAALV